MQSSYKSKSLIGLKRTKGKSTNMCEACGKKLSKDVVALHFKVFESEEVETFFCLVCLAKFLECEVEDLREAIRVFKEQGCSYFV